MRRRTTPASVGAKSPLQVGGAAFLFATVVLTATATDLPDPASLAAANIVGPDACAECHQAEAQVWRESLHQARSKLLPRDARTKEIAKALGIRRIKADERCTRCHFTVQELPDKRPKAIAGVSCESCHGPARDWLDEHANFGTKIATREDETADHRAKRESSCRANGMIRPVDLYELASNCFRCHTIDEEDVVNVGGHPVSGDFGLLSGTQGDLRHNFVRGDGVTNAESSVERRRIMFVLGHAVDLEYTLRALAKAREPGVYADGHRAHITQVVRALEQVNSRLGEDGTRAVGAILEPLEGLSLSPVPNAAIESAAQALMRATRRFEEQAGDLELSPLDPLLIPLRPSR